MGHLYVSKVEYNTLQDGPKRLTMGSGKLYYQSKFVSSQSASTALARTDFIRALQGNVLFSNELHRRYGDQGIVSISLHPGNLKTELTRHTAKIAACVVVRARTLSLRP